MAAPLHRPAMVVGTPGSQALSSRLSYAHTQGWVSSSISLPSLRTMQSEGLARQITLSRTAMSAMYVAGHRAPVICLWTWGRGIRKSAWGCLCTFIQVGLYYVERSLLGRGLASQGALVSRTTWTLYQVVWDSQDSSK